MSRSHNLKGQSQLYDRQRRVMLSNEVELDISGAIARVMVGSMDERPDEGVTFRRPAIVSAMNILAQLIEELGTPQVEANPDPDAPIMLRPRRRLSWTTCPTCDGNCGLYDALGNWHECDTCEGAGVCRLD